MQNVASYRGVWAVSIEVELHRKGGRLCPAARCGDIKCPLIVRATSEDVVVGNVFGALKHIRPHLWLNGLLNKALGGDSFRQVWFKRFSLRLWERQARYPPELLDFREGRTEPDVVIEWENPPTTVWIEAKWRSRFATKTNQAPDNDQVIRGIRTLLADTGHVQPRRLFDQPERRPLWVALLSHRHDPVLERVRTQCDAGVWRSDIAGACHLPCSRFVGTLTWADLRGLLKCQARHGFMREAAMMGGVVQYLGLKLASTRPTGAVPHPERRDLLGRAGAGAEA
jgi:hypothetical protein